MAFLYWLLPLVFLCSCLGTWMLRHYALSRSLLDVPNERSSHQVPTPRGGGVAVVLWDGLNDGAEMVDGVRPEELRSCVDNGQAELVNADGPHDYAAPAITTDQHRCTLPRLPVIELASAQ